MADEIGIITRDRNFNETEHYGMETVTFDTTDGGTQVFSKGQAVDGVEIVPDFSGGDMTVEAAEGTLFKSVVILKPEDLAEENIVKGKNIGGIEGAHECAGGSLGNGRYHVKVIDYDGTVLAQEYLDNGDIFTLPAAPSHNRLIFDGWSSTVDITDGTVTVADSDIIIGAMYYTASGATEIDISLTAATGKSFTFRGGLTNKTSIDWGDGTTDNTLTHTYADYGEYTLKIYGMTAIGAGSSSGGIVSATSSALNNTIVNVFFSNIVTGIGNYAFYGCASLTTITIPSSVKTIGTHVFYYGYSLQAFVIPKGVTTISTYVFQYCSSLQSIVIPNGFKTMGNYVFQYCYSLRSVVIPNGVTSIGNSMFQGCYSLHSVTIPNSVVTFGASMFRDCYSLRSVVIPNGVTKIDGYTFHTCHSIYEIDFSTLTSVPSLANTNAFTKINKRCKMLVPSALYNTWKSATYWSTYASYLVPV